MATWEKRFLVYKTSITAQASSSSSHFATIYTLSTPLNPLQQKIMLAKRHTVTLPLSPHVPKVVGATPPTPQVIAQEWITKFEAALKSGATADFAKVLQPDAWWRDFLALSWDLRTLHGLDKISAYLSDNLSHTTPHNLKLRQNEKFAPAFNSPLEGLEWVESQFDFETKVGRGSGMIRLVQGIDGTWKGGMIYTALQELTGSEDKVGAHRPHGSNELKIDGGTRELNWLEQRQKQVEFEHEEPTVLVVGAGQSGLNVGARLQAMGVKTLLVDKNNRIGDNWRNRYRVSRL